MEKIQFNKSSIIKLILLISFIVIMFSLLSFTFVTIIIKKNDNAYLQERTKQQLLDLNEKENNPNYITWEEYESILVDKLINIQSTNILNEYNQINSKVLESIEDFNKSSNGLSKEQLQEIIKRTLKGKFTTSQVHIIVNTSLQNKNLSVDDINNITNKTIDILKSKIGNISIRPIQMLEAINKAIDEILEDEYNNINELKQSVYKTINRLNNSLSNKKIKKIINEALDKFIIGGTPIINSSHSHIKCDICNKCIDINCDGDEDDVCPGHTPSHTHIECDICNKCIDINCNGTNDDKCQGHDQIHTHTTCEICGKCIDINCDGLDNEKCLGHNQYVSNSNQFFEALENESIIYITNSFTLEISESIIIDSDIIIDLQKNTLNINGLNDSIVFIIKSGCNLTIKDGTIERNITTNSMQTALFEAESGTLPIITSVILTDVIINASITTTNTSQAYYYIVRVNSNVNVKFNNSKINVILDAIPNSTKNICGVFFIKNIINSSFTMNKGSIEITNLNSPTNSSVKDTVSFIRCGASINETNKISITDAKITLNNANKQGINNVFDINKSINSVSLQKCVFVINDLMYTLSTSKTFNNLSNVSQLDSSVFQYCTVEETKLHYICFDNIKNKTGKGTCTYEADLTKKQLEEIIAIYGKYLNIGPKCPKCQNREIIEYNE